MSTKPIETLPARILLQVRDGVLNELLAFDLPIYETQPIGVDDPDHIDGARFNHRHNICDTIAALAEAQQKLIKQIRDAGAGENTEKWLRDLADWVIAA